MKKVLIAAALMTLTASVAAAQGISLNWSQCYPQNTTLINRNGSCYTCVAPVAAQRVIASFTAPLAMPNMVSATSIIDIVFATSQPDWWRFDGQGGSVPGCRANGATVAPKYLGTATLCPDLMFTSNVQGPILVAFNGWKGPNTMRLVIENSRDGVFDAQSGSHYVAQQMDLNANGESVDCNASPTPDNTPKCLGCQTAATLALNEVQMTPQSGAPVVLTAVNGRNFVHWNNGVGTPTPTQNKSWGAVKALYR
jgi:hypothetical protein